MTIPPAVQHILFKNIADHLHIDLIQWRDMYTQLYTSPEQKIQEILLSFLRQSGFTTTMLQMEGNYSDQKTAIENPIIYGEHANNATQTLLVYLKYTVKSPVESAMETSIGSVTHTASDIALPMIALVAACHAYRLHVGSVPINIKMLIAANTQSPQAHRYLERLISKQRQRLQADNCIVYTTQRETNTNDTLPEIVLGLKGHLRTEISIQTAKHTLPLHYGSIAPNAAWQLTWTLANLKDAHEDITLDGFYETVRPSEDALIESLASFPDTAANLAESWGTEQLLLGLHGIQQHYVHFLTPTCSIISLHSDTQTTAKHEHQTSIPTTAQAQLDFHLVPDQDPYTIFTKLQSYLHTHSTYPLQARLLSASYPVYTSIKEPLVHYLQHAIHTVHQQPPQLIPFLSDPIAFSILQKQLAIPTIGLTMPEPPDTKAEQASTYLAQCIQQNALLIANIGR